MQRALLILAGLAAFAGPAHAQRQAIWTSWGKADVSFDRYRSDAIECARAGVAIPVADTGSVGVLRRGSRQMESADLGMQAYGAGESPAQIMDRTVVQANQYQRIREGVRADVQVAAVKGMMTNAVERCLSARGYTQFRLTREQHKHLERLRTGVPERHRYLYALASDPEILAHQAVPAAH